MAGARQHTALPPREPPRVRPSPAPCSELSRTAASRPRPRWLGTPPHPSEVGPTPAGSGSNLKTIGIPPHPTPSPHPLAVGLYRCLYPQPAPVGGTAGVLAGRPGVWRPPMSPACFPPRCHCPGAGPSLLAWLCVLCVPAGPRLLPFLHGPAWASIVPSSLCPINYNRLFEGLGSVCPLPLIFSILR